MLHKNHELPFGLVYLLAFYPAFRNLFYVRIGSNNILLDLLCPRMSTLTIDSKNIGEGLFIPHGYATSIGASYIGKNCTITNNVTIGNDGKGNYPIILDNVRINAGAVLFGNITVGNNVIIGANATVNTNVPDNCTVFPPPSKIIKWNSNTTFKEPDFES
jgi:serine O-acetyltransferase